MTTRSVEEEASSPFDLHMPLCIILQNLDKQQLCLVTVTPNHSVFRMS